jgi:hypothetical protein
MAQLEIEVNRYGCYGLAVVILVLIAAFIGYHVSPQVKGHPVLLTTENYAIKRYLDRAEDWAEAMAQEQTRLADAASERTSQPDQTPTLRQAQDKTRDGTQDTAPASHPESIYDRAHQVRDARDQLERIRREMERTEVPPSLGGLHAMAVDAVEAQLWLANTVLNSIGAPVAVEPAEMAARLQRAEDLLRSLQEALAAQRQALRPFDEAQDELRTGCAKGKLRSGQAAEGDT